MSNTETRLNVAIVGSRDFTDYSYLSQKMAIIRTKLYKKGSGIGSVISGGAKGADSVAAEWARLMKIPLTVFEADWDKYGKSAGYKRNLKIVQAADLIVAFWDGESPGTQHTINIAKEAGIPCIIIDI